MKKSSRNHSLFHVLLPLSLPKGKWWPKGREQWFVFGLMGLHGFGGKLQPPLAPPLHVKGGFCNRHPEVHMPCYIPCLFVPHTNNTCLIKERNIKESVFITIWPQYLFLLDSEHNMLMKIVTGKQYQHYVRVMAGSRLSMKTEKCQ